MSDAVEVCPECDIADCRHIRSRRDISRITDLEAQLAAKDALIRDLTEALQSTENYIANTEREFDIELSSGTKARATLTRAKEMGYE